MQLDANTATTVDFTAKYLMWTLNHVGYEARICGGAVRDLLIGETPKDWDIATTATPDQVMDLMKSKSIHVIPTGLQHGTVTAVMDGGNYEITTLRVDQDTDGRHAVVEFTKDWKLDAQRRDFTINALYLDENNVVHDYFGGIDDLKQGVVRFVGAAEDRIQEDYLRIMRYFRFQTRMNPQGWDWSANDDEARSAIAMHCQGLTRVSGERIWSELKKIVMSQHRPGMVFRAMQKIGVMDEIGLRGMILRATPIEFDDRPAVRMASHFKFEHLKQWADVLRNRYKAARDEFSPIEFALKHHAVNRTRNNAIDILAFHSKSDVLAWAATHDDLTSTTFITGSIPGIRQMNIYDYVMSVDIPEFPVSGQDLIDLGFKTGPALGKMIHDLRLTWARAEFICSREYLINLVPMISDITYRIPT